MKRREFILALGGAAGWSALLPLAVRAQQGERMRRLGVLVVPDEDQPQAHDYLAAFGKSLADSGWVEGANIRVDFRFGGGNPDRAKAIAAEFVANSPDVILAMGTPATTAFQKATKTIPVVFTTVVDPVGAGLVESLARPGANITGFSTFEPEIGGKWLELLKEVSPGIRRVAGIVDLPFVAFTELWRATESAATGMGLDTTTINFHRRSDDRESAIASFAKSPDGALVVLPTGINSVDRSRIFALATNHRLPAVYPFAHYAAGGGLMTYGLDNVRVFTSGIAYVDRILKGAKPADLPVQTPTKFELAINLKAAKAIGLTVPPTMLARADEVIE